MLEQVCKEIADQHGVETMPIKCDITNTEEIEETVKVLILELKKEYLLRVFVY